MGYISGVCGVGIPWSFIGIVRLYSMYNFELLLLENLSRIQINHRLRSAVISKIESRR